MLARSMAESSPEPRRAEEISAQLRRITASAAFASSRQLRDFFLFVGEAAMAGRTHLDQQEIARDLLAKGASFNPNDDSTVRKLASIARQKLAEYYAGEGVGDPVIVRLPYRTYVPVFERLQSADAGRQPRRFRLWFVVGAAAVAVLATAAAWSLLGRRPQAPPAPTFTIQTQLGDFWGRILILPAGSVLLGPPLSAVTEVSARMRFSPDAEYQQAGLMIWSDPDHFVRLGRRFEVRTHLEFFGEHGAVQIRGPDTYNFDPEGQTGEPVWLSIRCDHRSFRAYVSPDGLTWRQVGAQIELPGDLPNPRLALYGLNGRRVAASIPAVFDRVSVGPNFANWTAAEWDSHPGRSRFGTCAGRPENSIAGQGLRLLPPAATSACVEEVLLPLAGGDSTICARLDYVPNLGSMAGILIRGDTKGFRIARGDKIRHLLDHAPAVDRPDWPGHPPLFVRLEVTGGMVAARYSRDGRDYTEFPPRVPLAALGPNLRYGVKLNASISPGSGAPALVPYLRQEIHRLTPIAAVEAK
jgi:hypothetical protein